jgi:hypothetical protein
MANKKLAELIAAASAAGTATASDWESDSGISIDDHRLRSLMNFERDVVKSTADDRDALPQWRAFEEAFDKKAKDHFVRMDEKRARRFHKAMREAMEANESLAILARKFHLLDLQIGGDEVQPKLVIDGMTSVVAKRLDLAYAMLIHAEEPEEEGND